MSGDGHVSPALRGALENVRVEYGTEVKAATALRSRTVVNTRMLASSSL